MIRPQGCGPGVAKCPNPRAGGKPGVFSSVPTLHPSSFCAEARAGSTLASSNILVLEPPYTLKNSKISEIFLLIQSKIVSLLR